MRRHTIPVGRVLGIPLELDYSWFLVFALVTWALAVGHYPAEFKGWPASLDHGRRHRGHALRERSAA